MKDLAYYMKLPYHLEIVKDSKENGYRLIYPELPGCMGLSFTKDEIDTLAYSIKRAWIEAALADGFFIPEPK